MSPTVYRDGPFRFFFLGRAQQSIERHEEEIRDAWASHFSS